MVSMSIYKNTMNQEEFKDVLPGSTEIRIKDYGDLDLSHLCQKPHYPPQSRDISKKDMDSIENEFTSLNNDVFTYSVYVIFFMIMLTLFVFIGFYCMYSKLARIEKSVH